MKKTKPWIVALMALILGQIGFFIAFSDATIYIRWFIGIPLELFITIPAILWWTKDEQP